MDFREGNCWAQDLSGAEKAARAKEWGKVIEILGPKVEALSQSQLHLLAEAHSQKQNHLTAIKILEASLAKHPKDASSKRKIGAELLKMNKEKEAKLAFRESIEINPKYEPAYLDLATLLEKADNQISKYDLLLLYQDLVKAVGEKPNSITKLCELTTMGGQYDLSPRYCMTGLKIAPNEPRNYVHLAMTYKDTGKMKEAETEFKRAAEKFPKSEYAQMSYADFSVAEKKDYLKAYTYYKRATEANPESLKAMYGLAHASIEIQKYEDAYKVFTKACRINRSAAQELRRGLSSLKQQKASTWIPKFDNLLDSCGLNLNQESDSISK